MNMYKCSVYAALYYVQKKRIIQTTRQIRLCAKPNENEVLANAAFNAYIPAES